MLFLTYGSFVDLGWKHIPKILTFQVVLTVVYLLIHKRILFVVAKIDFLKNIGKFKLDKLAYVILCLIFFVIGAQFYYNGFPIIKAFRSDDYDWIGLLRRDAFLYTPGFIKYAAFIVFKAALPFFIVYFFARKRYWILVLVLTVGFFYSINFLEKSIIMSVLMPLTIFATLKKRWFVAVLSFLLIVGHTYILIYATNPEIRPGIAGISLEKDDKYKLTEKEREEANKRNSISVANNLLYHRIFLLPGEMVNNWFEIIPDQKPFLNGKGYRFIAGDDFVDYNQELYAYVYPEFAEKGNQGNVNVACFVYDYANFGWVGLVLAGIVMALIFGFVDGLLKDDFVLSIVINTFPCLFLSSSSYTTLLLTGGWGALILLLVMFKKNFNEKS